MFNTRKEDNTDWGSYWKARSIKRVLMELLRGYYFSKVFTREIKNYTVRGSYVLEAGCGSGTYLKELERCEAVCFGLDLSEESINKARQNCSRVIRGDIRDLPFKHKMFDVVYNQGVMEHFAKDDFRKILREMKWVGKKVIVIVPSSLSIFRIYDPIKDDPNKHFFGKQELYNLMSEELKDVRVRYMWETGLLSIVGKGEG